MTTKNNGMFRNELVTKFVKVMSAMLVVCMLVFSMTACGTVSQQDVRPTTEHSTEEVGNNDQNEPVDPIDDGYWHDDPTEEPTTEEPTEEPTPSQSGAYTYTVYGDIQLSMDVNIDDYVITNSSGQEVFQLTRLALDLGWWPNDIDPASYGGTAEGWANQYSSSPMSFSYHTSSGAVINLEIDDLSDHDSRYNFNQIGFISYTFVGTSNSDSLSPEDKDVVIDFGNHYDDVEYLTPLYTSVMTSRDDIIILTYLLARANSNPLENPFYSTGIEAYQTSISSTQERFYLP